jgi:gentisate 1,2-dioxygenase
LWYFPTDQDRSVKVLNRRGVCGPAEPGRKSERLTDCWHTITIRQYLKVEIMSSGVDPINDAEDAALIEAMAEVNLKPLWRLYKGLNTSEPRHLEPILWSWDVTEPLIARAAAEVDMAHAERRALMLSHPALSETTFTTPTLSAALQILEPGEKAHAHRHTLAALRFVIAGDGAITTTDGKECLMRPGDLVLTPAWTWHKHYHPGSERAVWLDCLDAPLCTAIGTVFFEHGPGPETHSLELKEADEAYSGAGVLPQSGTVAHEHDYSPLFRYPWSEVSAALDSMSLEKDEFRRVRYVNPLNGGPVMPTIDCFAERFAKGRQTQACRTTATAIVIVVDGEGSSQIGSTQFSWKKNDVFTLPRWQWFQHTASSDSASLFLMTDRAFVSSIAHLREETQPRSLEA